MNGSELQDFKFDEYKKEISAYKNITEQLRNLEKNKKTLCPSFLFAYSISVLTIFVATLYQIR